MLHLKKWGGMLGLFALVAVAGAASYQFLNSGTKHSDGAREMRESNSNAGQANKIARNSFSKTYTYSDDFNDGNGVSTPGTSTKIGYLDDYVTFIVLYKEAPLAAYKGSGSSLAVPTKRAGLNGKLRLDVKSYESRNYLGYLQSQQRKLETKMSSLVGHEFPVTMRMQHAVNGAIVNVSRAEAELIRQMPEVLLVEAYSEVPMDTDTGPALIGAPAVWTGTNPGAPAAYRGEGMVVGMIDSGVNFGSPSFAATGPVDGYVHINPLGAGNYLGTCAAGQVDAGRCNDKLIGGYDFVCNAPGNQCIAANREEPGFGDTNGHGTHTASTAAGNVRDALYSGNTIRISGVAQRANVIAYDACYTNISTGQGLCPNVSTLASVNQAVADGIVDVINYSIGGGADPWTDSVSIAFLNAVDAGIYISASAGNSGPAANTLGHNEPWVSSTAAAQHGRAGYGIAMQVTGPAPVPANLAPLIVNLGAGGVAFSATIPAFTPLFISPGISTTSDGCAAFPANAFAGGIAVIRRGTCSFTIKTNNASAAGAIAVVIANNATGVILPSVPGTTVPVFSVTQTEGDSLRNFGQANPTTATAQISFPALPLPNIPDVLGSFSSRGPAGIYNLLKPDVTAPGVSVLAAVSGTTLAPGSENLVDLYNGTSMASPHQAGSATLMRQARPSWTVPEIKSALALTAEQTVYLEDSVTLANPFARGSGRIRVDRAINAGLVMNETRANYLAADPATGGNPSTLNQANLIDRSCFSICSFFRTFRNPSATATSWRVQLQGVSGSVTPIITVPGNGSLTLKINVYAYSLLPNGNFSFGNVVLTPATGSGPVLRMPVAIAVQPPAISMPASLTSVVPTNSAGSVTFTIGNTGGSALNYTFVNTGTASGIVSSADNTGVSNGFRNTTFTDPATAVNNAQYSADDFLVTESTQITSISTQGFVVSGLAFPGAASNLTWSIYPDAGGLPAGNPQSAAAAAIWTYTTTPIGTGVTTGGTPTSIGLNLIAAGQNVTLTPGRYWLLSNTRGTFANRWAQFGSNTTSGNSGFASISVSTTNTGSWAANTAFPGLAMRIVGNVPCGAAWISGTYATTGTLSRGTSRSALTAINTTGVAAGSYSGKVCVQSNDPLTPVLAVPLSLTVTP
jgi:hypothetical protein